MAEYIKREAIINRIKEYALDVYGIDLDDPSQFAGNVRAENFCEGLYEATELVDDITAADVAPLVHGRWENGNPICPVCGEDKFKDLDADIWCDWLPPFCPRCGAKMDERNDYEEMQ